jgi:anti-anti-sigma regulatory factor
MPIEFKKNRAMFREEVTVEEAEGLLEWLQTRRTATVDLTACTHLHTSNLQVLMSANTSISNWPKDAGLRAWLEPALQPVESKPGK